MLPFPSTPLYTSESIWLCLFSAVPLGSYRQQSLLGLVVSTLNRTSYLSFSSFHVSYDSAPRVSEWSLLDLLYYIQCWYTDAQNWMQSPSAVPPMSRRGVWITLFQLVSSPQNEPSFICPPGSQRLFLQQTLYLPFLNFIKVFQPIFPACWGPFTQQPSCPIYVSSPNLVFSIDSLREYSDHSIPSFRSLINNIFTSL